VRGKVNCFRLDGIEDEAERKQVIETAREYFRLAGSYVEKGA
jgi:aminoglycoside phosphotransferase family enzyme